MADGSGYTFGDWQLTPEGAAIHLREETVVVADVHLGYEWARGAAGDCVIAHSLEETLGRLALVIARFSIKRLVVAGDLVESGRPCHRTRGDVRGLHDWLSGRGISLLALEGNHDRGLARLRLNAPQALRAMPSTCEIGRWTIGHGHVPLRASRTLSGHHHPVLRVGRNASPCFLVGASQIILPAFSSNAAGCDVARAIVPKGWLVTPSLHCLVSTGLELLDLGPLTELRRKMRRLEPGSR